MLRAAKQAPGREAPKAPRIYWSCLLLLWCCFWHIWTEAPGKVWRFFALLLLKNHETVAAAETRTQENLSKMQIELIKVMWRKFVHAQLLQHKANHPLEGPLFAGSAEAPWKTLGEIHSFQIVQVSFNQSSCSAFPLPSHGTCNPWDTPLLWSQTKITKYHPKVHGTNCLGASTARSTKMIISISY